MEAIGQQEHIESLMKESVKRDKKATEIQQVYEMYIKNFSDEIFTELILLLDEYCTRWVEKHLWNTACYSEENEHTVLQNARLAVWKSIQKDIEQGISRDNFVFYAFGIYKKKTLDIIRNVSRERSRMEVNSIDESVGDKGRRIMDYLPPVQPDFGEQDEIRYMYDKLFRIYCTAFLTSKAFPPRTLALYYARVLPHLLDEILESKATSSKWAFERMGNQSMWGLKQDSENTIRTDVDSSLSWGNDFVLQLNSKTDITGSSTLLRDVIFTSVYNKGKIEDWADYMHKTTIKTAANLIFEDKELLELVKDYVPRKDILYRFVKEGENR